MRNVWNATVSGWVVDPKNMSIWQYLSLSSCSGVVAKVLSSLDMTFLSSFHPKTSDFQVKFLCFSDFKQPSKASHMPSACTIKMVSGSNWLQWIPKIHGVFLAKYASYRIFWLLQKFGFWALQLGSRAGNRGYINCNIALIKDQSWTPGEFSWFGTNLFFPGVIHLNPAPKISTTTTTTTATTTTTTKIEGPP